MIEVLAALAGLLIGSFLNVCIHRLPRDLSVVRPRSFCPRCGTPIAWYDNIPLASFVLLRGRCRQCRGRIPVRYPVVELGTAALFFAAVRVHGASPAAWKLSLFAALLVGLIFADLEQRILPDEFTLGGLVAGIGLAAFVPVEPGLLSLFFAGSHPRLLSVAEALSAAALCAGGIWLVGQLYYLIRRREGLGLGDVKMLGMIGAFLGLRQSLLVMLLGSLIGSVAGLLYIRLKGKDPRTYELPYGTFLGIAALAVSYLGLGAPLR